MKVMNEIKATEKVKIIKILVENGQSVDSQQDLFVVEKI
jgi:biotin carboxyl carrier protein